MVQYRLVSGPSQEEFLDLTEFGGGRKSLNRLADSGRPSGRTVFSGKPGCGVRVEPHMKTPRLRGRVQAGKGDAARWLSLFNSAYSRKLGGSVFPGSLNLALDETFDWFSAEVAQRTMWFDRSEYGGERDILLVPCVLENLGHEPAWLWTPTTAARDRPDPWVVEVVAFRNLRQTFGLRDGSIVEVLLLDL